MDINLIRISYQYLNAVEDRFLQYCKNHVDINLIRISYQYLKAVGDKLIECSAIFTDWK